MPFDGSFQVQSFFNRVQISRVLIVYSYSLLFSIFLKVDDTVKIASITLFEGHFSDPQSMIYTSLYFESGGSSTCRSFSSVKKRRQSLQF